MKTLTSEHLQEMIERCVGQANTKGLIVTETAHEARDVCVSFRESNLPEVEKVYVSPVRNEIRFKNGSYITVKGTSESLRGYRADMVLYDEFIDEAMHPILRHCELSPIARDYVYDKNRWMRTRYTATDAGTYMSPSVLTELAEQTNKNYKAAYMGDWTIDRSADDSGILRRTAEDEDEPSPELDTFLDSFTIRTDN